MPLGCFQMIGLHALAEEFHLTGLGVRSDHFHVSFDVALLGWQRRSDAHRHFSLDFAIELAPQLDARVGEIFDSALLLAEMERRTATTNDSNKDKEKLGRC